MNPLEMYSDSYCLEVTAATSKKYNRSSKHSFLKYKAEFFGCNGNGYWVNSECHYRDLSSKKESNTLKSFDLIRSKERAINFANIIVAIEKEWWAHLYWNKEYKFDDIHSAFQDALSDKQIYIFMYDENAGVFKFRYRGEIYDVYYTVQRDKVVTGELWRKGIMVEFRINPNYPSLRYTGE